MLHYSISAFGLIAAIVVAGAGSIWAAVPLSQVRSWQDSAPEAVNVTALSIDQTLDTHPDGNGGSVTTTLVTLTAKVDIVHRTVSGLVPGSVIAVRYSRSGQTPPMPDIQQDIVLSIGESAAAYLRQADEKTYILACPFGCLEGL